MGKDHKFSAGVFQLRPEGSAVKSSVAAPANTENEVPPSCVETVDNVSQTLYPVAEASAAILFHQLPRKPAAEITSAGQLLDLFR